jgi:hypothetical protein
MATDSGSGSRTTSWLPATTAFSAPADCASLIWGAHAPWLAVYDPGFGLSVDPSLTCLPPAATNVVGAKW